MSLVELEVEILKLKIEVEVERAIIQSMLAAARGLIEDKDAPVDVRACMSGYVAAMEDCVKWARTDGLSSMVEKLKKEGKIH
jgi:hypothetical protein